MSLFEITVKNNMTGEVNKIDAGIFTLVAGDIKMDGVFESIGGIAEPETMAKVAIGMDHAKGTLLNKNPFAKMLYDFKNLFFDEGEIIDVKPEKLNNDSGKKNS